MTDPVFREPKPPKRERNFGRGHHYSADEVPDRLARLEKEGRRCDGNSRTCVLPATRQFTVIELNTDTQEPREGALGRPRVVRTCARHAPVWGSSSRFRVVEQTRIVFNPPPGYGRR